MWRGLLHSVSCGARLGRLGYLLWLEWSLGQELQDLLEGQLGLGRAEIQSQQPALARASPVDGRSAAPPRWCSARGTRGSRRARLHDFAIFDSAHYEEEKRTSCILAGPAGFGDETETSTPRQPESPIITPRARGSAQAVSAGLFVSRGSYTTCMSRVARGSQRASHSRKRCCTEYRKKLLPTHARTT